MATISSLEALVERLNENRSSSQWINVRLPLDEHSNIADLLEALAKNPKSCIEEVNIDVYNSFRTRPDSTAEILQLFAALSLNQQHLQRLWVDSGRDEGCPFFTLPVQALAVVLQQAPQLKRLALYDVELAGDVLEFQQLELALERHKALQVFGLVGCRLADETIQSAGCESAGNCTILAYVIGKSLAAIPSLEWVELSGQEIESLGTIPPDSFGSLCSSSSLTKLTIDRLELMDAHVLAMSFALERSTSIKELKWTLELGTSGCAALGHLLRNNTSLENVTLQLNDVVMDSSNSTDEEQQTDPTIQIAQGLQHNESVEYFTLCGFAKISQQTQQVFATLLWLNTTLVHLSIDMEHCTSLPEDLQIEMEMYLKLNEVGRKQLLEDAATPPQQWIDTLWKMRHNLNGIFYLISVNPMLCSLAGSVNCSQCEMFDTLIKYGNSEQKIRLS